MLRLVFRDAPRKARAMMKTTEKQQVMTVPCGPVSGVRAFLAAQSPFFARLTRRGFARSRQLAQSLRPVSVMTAIRSAILFVFNVLNERRERVAGQEVRAAGQDLPGVQGEDRPCR
ncbi:hypothetical protein [Brevundimonas sp.]|uniref:hypothetical protein n=1 Tax=Brevundimonas sp. TaxID=1871086 RepID=UPI001AC20B7F|nr:hypothetical protein [Brevundimonas sp.]MBN9465290.1 hypothetical protein [Brevundimonas sp.]